MNLTKISKKLSLVLRHQPEAIGLTLDDQGWAYVEDLIQRLNEKGLRVDKAGLKEVVRTNDKQRFRFSDDETRIRANQGHSLAVDLEMKPLTPPELLYHGTATRFLESIEQAGLIKKSRQHVHMSLDLETARKVGSRHGRVIILLVGALQIHKDGYAFYQSDNGVWLTDHVPAKYITKPIEE